jgi:hypothetical protein
VAVTCNSAGTPCTAPSGHRDRAELIWLYNQAAARGRRSRCRAVGSARVATVARLSRPGRGGVRERGNEGAVWRRCRGWRRRPRRRESTHWSYLRASAGRSRSQVRICRRLSGFRRRADLRDTEHPGDVLGRRRLERRGDHCVPNDRDRCQSNSCRQRREREPHKRSRPPPDHPRIVP